MSTNDKYRSLNKMDKGRQEWTVQDINGKSHSLKNILGNGHSVMLFFTTTWCSVSWEVVESKVLDDIYRAYGPKGTDELVVLFLEADPRTDLDHLRGDSIDKDTIGTMGNWLSDHDYPIIDDTSLAKIYEVDAFPSTILIPSQGEITKILGGSDLTVENIGKWLENTSFFAMKSFGSPACKARGFAGDVEGIINNLEGKDYPSVKKFLKEYLESIVNYHSWNFKEFGSKKLYINCGEAPCTNLVLTDSVDEFIFNVEQRNSIGKKEESTFYRVSLIQRHNSPTNLPEIRFELFKKNGKKEYEHKQIISKYHCETHSKTIERNTIPKNNDYYNEYLSDMLKFCNDATLNQLLP